ncbi:MAG: deoxyguanosinetriphosphate triphosphohydrolase [Rickettsiales bacterium]|nr:deoxyguanosinetriphosphate triphosphohydrolase [Rickettsiales bacterium]
MFKHLASNPNNSKGRLYKEIDDDQFRTPFERDRGRVIHSNSFRKLKHKTQVFIESESDYFRTRLTHSLEVAQIARSLCRLFSINEDLGETVALAHDLGHPPFGHNGEKALNDVMSIHGGFNHNDQTLRVITFVEKRHPDFDGLNLSWESLEGIVKHNGPISSNIPFHINNYNIYHNLDLKAQPNIESQVAAISDDVAYNNHDVEDAIRAGLINISQLSDIDFFKEIIYQIKGEYKKINENHLTFQLLRKSISAMISDIYVNTKTNIMKLNLNSLDDINNHNDFIVKMSKEMNDKCLSIRDFLNENVYNHQTLLVKRKKAEEIIMRLFRYFENTPNKLPEDWINITNYPLERIICDYISGMTDRFASRLYRSIYE